MNILVLAPHQDDEILGAGGLIQVCRNRGDSVWVVFATNGDYRGVDVACQRYRESSEALSQIGVSESEIYYLGYGDTGMRASHSFLLRLLRAPMDQALSSPISSVTYHPAGRNTVRKLRTKEDGSLTKREFLSDLTWCVKTCAPDLLVCPYPSDVHGDHAALAKLTAISCVDLDIPMRLSFLIHGGDDLRWPSRTKGIVACPPVVPADVWKQRIVIPLTAEQCAIKRRLIGLFATQQQEDECGFLYAFARNEEFFFPVPDSYPTRKMYPFFK